MDPSLLQMAIKGTVTIPAWQQQLLNGGDAEDHITNVALAYANVPIIHRAVKMRCDALASVPIKIMKGKTETEWPFKCPVDQLLWKIEAALLGDGKAVVLKLRNHVKVLDLMWLNPLTITVQAENNAGDVSLRFIQDGAGEWGEDAIIYIKEFSYSNDVTGGNSVVQSCLQDAALMNYQTRFASKFFESGAMPIILASADGVTLDKAEKERIQKFFTRLATGVRNAWRVLATTTKISTDVVSQDLDKMTIPELYKQAVNNISTAFGIPVNMFTGDDNYASADSHRMQFWQDVVRPRGTMIQNEINRQLLKPLGLEMVLGFDEIDIFQEDEAKRAQSFKTYVDAGVNPEAAKEILGIEFESTTIPFMLPKPEPVAPVVINKPDEKQPDPYAEEMGKWERKALKRGKGTRWDCEFDSDIIPEGVQDEIHKALKLCVSADEVKEVFGATTDSNLALIAELKKARSLLESEIVSA